jgi:hypothetical protein
MRLPLRSPWGDIKGFVGVKLRLERASAAGFQGGLAIGAASSRSKDGGGRCASDVLWGPQAYPEHERVLPHGQSQTSGRRLSDLWWLSNGHIIVLLCHEYHRAKIHMLDEVEGGTRILRVSKIRERVQMYRR